MKELAVFGLGRLGRSLAITYSQLGGKVIVVDKEQDKIDEIADDVTYAIRADVTEEKVMKELGISGVDMAIVSMSDNFEASIIISALCKEMGIPYIVAKAKDILQGDVLKKVGVDEIIYPEVETGVRMANNIAHGENFMDIAAISDDFSIVQAKVPHNWIGKTLAELNPRQKFGFNIIAVKDNGRFVINIDANEPFKEDVELVVLGGNKELSKVFK